MFTVTIHCRNCQTSRTVVRNDDGSITSGACRCKGGTGHNSQGTKGTERASNGSNKPSKGLLSALLTGVAGKRAVKVI